ncbi:MAG: AI-2E family transporter [Calditrichia bacterium]
MKNTNKKRTEMVRQPREIIIQGNRIIIGLLSILTVVAVGIVLYQIRSIILPFALAVFITFILNPMIEFFEKHRIPSFLAIIFALVITFLVLNFFGVMAYTSVKSFASEFPQYEERLNRILSRVVQFLNIPQEVLDSENRTQDGINWLASVKDLSLHTIVLNTLGSIVNIISNSLLVLLFMLFIFIGRNQLVVKVKLAFEAQMANRIVEILQNINAQIQKYLIAKTMISLATGLLYAVVLSLFGVEFAIIWGILAFLLNFIPNIGSVIATILPLSIAFLQFEGISTLIWLALILSSIQFVIGNLIDPRVIGRSLNLSPLMVLFSLMFWGWLWGIIGMFLAVPLMVIIKIVFENIESLRFISVLMSAK